MAAVTPLKLNTSGLIQPFQVGDTLDTSFYSSGGAPSVIEPSQITSSWAHNWAPTGLADATTIRVDFDNSLPGITGLSATGISDGERKRIVNDGQYFGLMMTEHSDSTAANRIRGGGVDFLMPYGGCVELEYDGTASRWRVVSNNFNPSTYPGIIYSQISPGSVTAGDNADAAFTVSGTAAAVTGINASTGFPGARRLATGSTSTGAATISAFKGVGSYATARNSHIIAAGLITLPGSLSDGTNRYTVEAGMTTAPTGTSAITTGCFLRYSDNVNSGKWQLVSANTGTESTADSGVTVAASTSYRYLISLDSGGYEACFFLNGVYVGKVTTNTPSGDAIGHRVTIRKSVGTSSSLLDIANMVSYAIYSGQ